MAWFARRRGEQKKALERLETRLIELEHSLQELIKQGISYEIKIEELNVHDPYLDHLTFRFDKLDVKEVSGALNLGNNFGVNVHQDNKKKTTASDATDKTSQTGRNGPAINISRSGKQPMPKADFKKRTSLPKNKGSSKGKNTSNRDMEIRFQPMNKVDQTRG